jgi:CDP-glycerol glycerophosphotransferase (TagB/SpsB family)
MYKWLSTNAKIFLELGEKTYDADFKAFYDAMKKHTYDYENLALFEDMKNTFFARIQNCPKVSPNIENA